MNHTTRALALVLLSMTMAAAIRHIVRRTTRTRRMAGGSRAAASSSGGSGTCATTARGALYTSASLPSKLAHARRVGPNGMHVVTDFDHTLTSPTSDECHDVMAKAPMLPAAFRDSMVCSPPNTPPSPLLPPPP